MPYFRKILSFIRVMRVMLELVFYSVASAFIFVLNALYWPLGGPARHVLSVTMVLVTVFCLLRVVARIKK